MIAMHEALAVEFQAPTGELISFEWDSQRLAALDPDPAADPVWRLGGELDWEDIELVRVLSGRLDDGRLIAIAALRPTGVDGHGDDLVAGSIGDANGFERIDESLLSTEYGADGSPQRIGLELYPSEDGMALRLAGTVSAAGGGEAGGVRRTAAAMTLGGTASGVAMLDLLRRG